MLKVTLNIILQCEKKILGNLQMIIVEVSQNTVGTITDLDVKVVAVRIYLIICSVVVRCKNVSRLREVKFFSIWSLQSSGGCSFLLLLPGGNAWNVLDHTTYLHIGQFTMVYWFLHKVPKAHPVAFNYISFSNTYRIGH